MAYYSTHDDLAQASLLEKRTPNRPQLSAADVEQALGYAAAAVRNEVLLSAEVGT